MVTKNVADRAAASDGLSVVVSNIAFPGITEKGGAVDALQVAKYFPQQIPVQGPPVNSNPSFAGGSSAGWGALNGSFLVSSSPPAGSPQPWAAQFANNGSALGAIEESGAPFSLVPDNSPLMTCWVNSASGLAVIGFDWQNGAHGLISTTTETVVVPPNTWVQLAFAANPPWASAPVFAYPRIGPGALSTAIWVTQVLVTYQSPLTAVQAPAVFVKSTMPVMHVQNLVTGQWLHRNVQGITQPSITWNLNSADSFTCTLAPPRPDLMDATGNPLFAEWRDACYLEEDGSIKFGGILTASTIQGAGWQQTWSGFAAYPNGIPYEGANYSVTDKEAMDVIRYLWNWVQTQHSNIGMTVDATNTGVLLGAQPSAAAISDKLGAAAHTGDSSINISHPDAFQAGMVITVGSDTATYTIKSMSNHTATLTARLKGNSSRYPNGAPVVQVVAPNPFTLFWYNSTDVGQEIDQIRQEAVFDWREVHAWSDIATKAGVSHTWKVGVHRLGSRRSDLRFAEGENIIQAATVTRDGSLYADQVIGLGYGSGSSTIRATSSGNSGRLSRPFVYTNAGAQTTARISSMTTVVLNSMLNIDAVTQIVIKDHPHAPFGSFFVGDDIPVVLCTGWRNVLIWSRITSIQQNPETNIMTLTLARSDSFTYLAQSGQGGTL